MAINVAQGVKSLQNTPYMMPVLSDYVIKNFYERSIVSEITNGDVMKDADNTYKEIIFRTEPDVGAFRPYAIGQVMENDQVSMSFVPMKIRYAAYKSVILYDDDMALCLDSKGFVETGIIKSIRKNLERLFQPFVFCTMLHGAAKSNMGKNAGMNFGTDLGDAQAPVALTPASVDTLFANMAQVLGDSFYDIDDAEFGDVFAVCSPAVYALIMRCPQYLNNMATGLTGRNAAITNRLDFPVRGFKIYKSHQLQASADGVETVLFGCKMATGFYANVIRSRISSPSSQMSSLYQTVVIYDSKVLYPQLLGVAMGKLKPETDGAAGGGTGK